MRVREVMTRRVRLAYPQHTIADAARIMRDIGAGVLPVADEERLVGMLTERDITVRVIAAGKGYDTPIEQVMTREVPYCYEDDDVVHAARRMARARVRRLAVVDREKQLVGIVSLGDVERAAPEAATEEGTT